MTASVARRRRVLGAYLAISLLYRSDRAPTICTRRSVDIQGPIYQYPYTGGRTDARDAALLLPGEKWGCPGI